MGGGGEGEEVSLFHESLVVTFSLVIVGIKEQMLPLYGNRGFQG